METEIIILAYYLNISNIPSIEIDEYLYRIHENFDMIEWPEGSFVKTFIIPVNDQRTRIECIFPINMNDESTNKAFQSLSEASEQLIKYVKDGLNTTDITDKPE